MAAGADNTDFPFGSARFAGPKELSQAGLYRRDPFSVLIGFDGELPLWYSGPGGAVLIAGARSGKLNLLGFSLCAGVHSPSMVVLDMKGGELAAVSQNQTLDRKYNIYWNPRALHGLRTSRINPVDYIRIDSPTLVSDTKVFCENSIPPSGSAQSTYFEGRAREYLEAIALTLTRKNDVLTLPDLYDAINLLVAGGDEWLDFAFEMTESGFPIAKRVEEEIGVSRGDSSGGFRGVLGELTNAFACLSDPTLIEAVSPPFDFSFADLCRSDQTYNVYLMPPVEFAGAWSAVIKAMFVAGMIYKSRSPAAPRQTWVLDECAQLGAFPLVVKLFTYGAGIGIRPWAVFQSVKQMKALGPDADTIILSSAALQNWFGIRDLETASMLSRMLGSETLRYTDEHRREASRHARLSAVQALASGRDPFRAALELAHHTRMAALPTLKARPLRNADELLGLASDKQVIFVDGVMHPVLADRRAYYDQVAMAGRFHPNPYHPPADRVRVMTRGGPVWRPVVVEPVPRAFARYPQYADGLWSRIG